MTENENIFAADTAEEEIEAAEEMEETVSEDAEELADAEPVLEESPETAEEAAEEIAPVKKEMSKEKKLTLQIIAAIVACIIVSSLTVFFAPRVKYVCAVSLAKMGKTDVAYNMLSEVSGSYKKAEFELKRFKKVPKVEIYSQPDGSKQELKREVKTKKNYFKEVLTLGEDSQTTETYYDKNGNVTKEVIKDSMGNERTTINTYDKNGNCTKTVTTSKSQGNSYDQTTESKNFKTYYIKKK